MSTDPCLRPLSYWEWITREAALIHADGCTGITNLQGRCCLEHDLQFFYGRDAADAYRRYARGEAMVWALAHRITFEEANTHFRACHFRESRLGYLNLVGWYRYAVVRRRKGRAAWDAHRAREAQATDVSGVIIDGP